MTTKTDKNSNPVRAGAQLQPEHRSSDTNPKAHPQHEGGWNLTFERITERMMELLAQGTVPWQKPWTAIAGLPRNLITGKPYRGVNVFLLLAMNYQNPFWLTFNQVAQLGGRVRKGEKACPVVFWKRTLVEDEETEEERTIPLLRLYHVFNLSQCEGLKQPEVSTAQSDPLLTAPAELVACMPQRPSIRHCTDRAFYSPIQDYVGMPDSRQFVQEEEYFSTLFHELVHSTGHQSRLHRPTLTRRAGFGSSPYCKEELIAEMGAAFLCGHAGISERTIKNSAAYINGWLEHLRADKTLVVQAAAQAQKAADFILGRHAAAKPTGTPESVET